jgi:DNA invertase Pin-like site-specific DNA recombinase
MFFNILASFAEFEVDLIRLRTIEGMARARQRGKLKGKQPKLNPQQRVHLLQLDREGKKTPTGLV